ncbi:MAG: DoxX family membrane protein [Frankiaceae bacterium]
MAETREPRVGADPAVFVRVLTALRIFTGLVWLTNGLAKVVEKSKYDLGFFSFNLVTKATARAILTDAAAKTGLRPLGGFYQQVVLPHWGVWQVFLTLAELAVGVGLVFGIATRLAAVGGLLLIGPVWIMLWHTNLYLWQYPAEDLFPLVLLAIAPAGRLWGMDRTLGARFRYRWPF